jgi:hypothetical protein
LILDPSIAIISLDDPVRGLLDNVLDSRVIVLTSDQMFDGKDWVVVGRGVSTNVNFTVSGESHDGWGYSCTFIIFEDARSLPVQDTDARVGCAEINTHDRSLDGGSEGTFLL